MTEQNTFEAADGPMFTHDDGSTETITEAADSFVLQAGATFYGPFEDDDAAFAYAQERGFTEINIRAVVAP